MLRNRPRYTLINSWHENETESDAMWKLYAGHGEGIAIRTTYHSLRESLIGKEVVSIEKVEYVDYDTTRVQLSNPLAQFHYKTKELRTRKGSSCHHQTPIYPRQRNNRQRTRYLRCRYLPRCRPRQINPRNFRPPVCRGLVQGTCPSNRREFRTTSTSEQIITI